MKNSQRNSRWSSFYGITNIFFIVAILLTTYGGPIDACFIDSEYNYGSTFPSGDIFLQVGQPLELFCSINLEKAKAENFSVEDLVFKKDNLFIEPSFITRVNETTARLYVENQHESSYMYYCILQKRMGTNNSSSISAFEASASTAGNIDSRVVCMNWVVVGLHKPREIQNYTCISLNWQTLKCSWQVPENNLPTNYKIEYRPAHRYNERSPCPTDSDVKENFCEWTLRSTPMYRKNFEILNIFITGTNKMGSIEQTFQFKQYANILLDGPKDLHLLTKNSTSMTLQWNIGDLQFFPKPLDYKIQYKSANDSEWHTILATHKDVIQAGQHISFTMTGLSPKTVYSCRVFMKSSLASDRFWATYTSQLFLTN